jgi:hypothetical protein
MLKHLFASHPTFDLIAAGLTYHPFVGLSIIGQMVSDQRRNEVTKVRSWLITENHHIAFIISQNNHHHQNWYPFHE